MASPRRTLEDYLWVTADWGGVDNTSGKLLGRCFSEYFWFAPTCRADPLVCYPYITGDTGYEYEHWMQKSTVFNIPLVIVVARLWSDFTTLPTQVFGGVTYELLDLNRGMNTHYKCSFIHLDSISQ